MDNGSTILEEQVVRIQQSGVIDEIVIVIGFLAEHIEEKIRMFRTNGMRIKTIYNPFYNISNNLISLWLARHEMDTDFLITNGDNIFSPDVFTDFVGKNENGVYLSVSIKDSYDDDDMKVVIRNNIVAKVSKAIRQEKISAESPGLALVHGTKSRELFIENIETLVKDRENINKFWLEVFNVMSRKGIPIHPWEFDGKTKWQEIDFHPDLIKVRKLLQLKF